MAKKIKIDLKIRGLKEVTRNLNSGIRKIKGRTERGMGLAAIHVKGEAQKLCPVDTGNLRSSAFVTTGRSRSGPYAKIGFGAYYAVYVHEINKRYRVGQWKFLETALRRSRSTILRILRLTASARR